MIRNHQRAARAHGHVAAVLAESKRREGDSADKLKRGYGSICHKLPILIHNEGLAVALHFTAGRDADKRRLLVHLADQLQEAGLLKEPTADALLAKTHSADLAGTQTLTREVQRCLDWYKRFTKSVLKIDSGEGDDQ